MRPWGCACPLLTLIQRLSWKWKLHRSDNKKKPSMSFTLLHACEEQPAIEARTAYPLFVYHT